MAEQLRQGPAIASVAVGKASDETVNNTTSYQDDDDLVFAIGANEIWAFELVIRYDSNATADIKISFTLPTGATMSWHTQGTNQSEFDSSTNRTEAGSGAARLVSYNGIVFAGSNAGNVQLQWAQATQDASDTKVLQGSYIIARKLS